MAEAESRRERVRWGQRENRPCGALEPLRGLAFTWRWWEAVGGLEEEEGCDLMYVLKGALWLLCWEQSRGRGQKWGDRYGAIATASA